MATKKKTKSKKVPARVVKRERKDLLVAIGVVSLLFIAMFAFFMILDIYRGPSSGSDKPVQGLITCDDLGCPQGSQFIGSKNSNVYHECDSGFASAILVDNRVCFMNVTEAESKGYRRAVQGAFGDVCGIENCHGLDIECGTNVPDACTEIYVIGDFCRQFAKCEIIDGKCGFVDSEEFTSCKLCVEECMNIPDGELAFECEDECRNFLVRL